jgi:hypothetical protein
MSNDFEKTANELQESIMEDAKKIYSEKVIERWLNRRNLGKVRNPDGFGKIKGPLWGHHADLFQDERP